MDVYISSSNTVQIKKVEQISMSVVHWQVQSRERELKRLPCKLLPLDVAGFFFKHSTVDL